MRHTRINNDPQMAEKHGIEGKAEGKKVLILISLQQRASNWNHYFSSMSQLIDELEFLS